MLRIEKIFSFLGFSTARANGAVLEVPCRRRAALCDKIAGYANLTADDFDGDSGHAPAQKDIDNALSLIAHIPDAAVETAGTIIAADGEVGFEWKTAKHLEISFFEGEMSFFGDLPNGGGRLSGEGIYNQNAVPADLRRLMSALFC